MLGFLESSKRAKLPQKKTYNILFNVGKCKYLVSFHNGINTHNDGSPFFNIRQFKNKVKLKAFEKELLTKGYIYN